MKKRPAMTYRPPFPRFHDSTHEKYRTLNRISQYGEMMIETENAILQLDEITLLIRFLTENPLSDDDIQTGLDILDKIAGSTIKNVQETFYREYAEEREKQKNASKEKP